MYVRKFIHDPEQLLAQGQEIVSQTADNKFVHRVSMVNLMLAGFSAADLAPYCGDSERTLMSWVKKVDEQGWESLIAIKQKGRPQKLTEEQQASLKRVISDSPSSYGYNVWDGPSVSDYISKEYNVEMNVRSCQLLLHRLGFSLVRPQTYPSLANLDENARDEFKKN